MADVGQAMEQHQVGEEGRDQGEGEGLQEGGGIVISRHQGGQAMEQRQGREWGRMEEVRHEGGGLMREPGTVMESKSCGAAAEEREALSLISCTIGVMEHGLMQGLRLIAKHV